MGLLPADRIQAVYEAAIACGLASQQDALLAGLPAVYAVTLPHAGPPAARLLQTLHALNDVPALTDGTVPFAIWLRNAATLTVTRVEVNVFTQSLKKIASARRRASAALGNKAKPTRSKEPDRKVKQLKHARNTPPKLSGSTITVRGGEQATVNVTLLLRREGKRVDLVLRRDMRIARIVDELVKKFRLPVDVNGEWTVPWSLSREAERSSHGLSSQRTLAEEGIKDGDVLSLYAYVYLGGE